MDTSAELHGQPSTASPLHDAPAIRYRRRLPVPIREASVVAGIYLVLGSAWILLSDRAVAAISGDPAVLTMLQTLKGWFYVGLTAVLAYVLVGSLLRREQRMLSAQGALRRLTHLDHLTGLPNRHHLLEWLHARAGRPAAPWGALLLVDIDGFRRINDALGPARGDDVLRWMASRLRQMVSDQRRLARISTDVYAIVLDDANDPDAALDAARRLVDRIRASLPALVDDLGTGVPITICVGIGQIDPAESDGCAALARAETALHRAQERGVGQVCVYGTEMREEAAAFVAAATRLRLALDAGQLQPYLQPQCAPDGRIVAAELLARWLEPDGTGVPPSEFISLAEECGLIGTLGEKMLEAACLLSVKLRRQGSPIPLAVNLSAHQLLQPDFVEQIDRMLQRTGADPHDLTLEITESVVIDGFDEAAAVLTPLRRRGFRISLDDFGTGYSSLSYLKQLPVDELKIDGSFVRGATDDPRGRALIEAIVAVARVLGLDVVAEGVETEEQIAMLNGCGCHALQGYWFGRPMSATDFERRIAAQSVDTGPIDQPIAQWCAA